MKQIGVIQVLRATAALMVVLSHAQSDALNEATKAGFVFVRTTLLPWNAGVDLFFVISGFIMVYASQRLFATPGAGGVFIGRRLARIVPLYWLITAISLVIIATVAWRGRAIFPGLDEIAASLGFVPFARPSDGAPRPIVPLGWTLNYEMYFYAVFALFVGFRRGVAVAGVALALGLAVGLGVLFHPTATTLAYWSDPIVLEFVLGMAVAVMRLNGLRLPRWLAAVMAVIAMTVLALDLDGMGHVDIFAVDPNGFTRVFACGVPMTLLFAAAVLVAPDFAGRGRVWTGLSAIGDASYALYLFHPLVVIFARKLYLLLGLPTVIGFWPLVVADLILAVGLAWVVHRMIETPLAIALRRWRHAPRGRATPARTVDLTGL